MSQSIYTIVLSGLDFKSNNSKYNEATMGSIDINYGDINNFNNPQYHVFKKQDIANFNTKLISPETDGVSSGDEIQNIILGFCIRPKQK
jgi:hypothetical protein